MRLRDVGRSAATFFKSGETDMTKGKPWLLLLKFSIPLLLGNLLQQLYNVVDSIIVGRYVGKAALAAVGSTYAVSFFSFSLFMGIGIGASVVISQFYGAKKHERMQTTVDTIYKALFVGGLVVTVLGYVFAHELIILLQVPEDAAAMSASYLRIAFLGTLCVVGYNTNAGILQGLGDTVSPLIYLAISAFLNVVLDLLFVVVFHMGVEGAALATILSQGTSFVYGSLDINRKKLPIRIRFNSSKFDWEIFGSAVRIGLPAGLQNAFFSLGMASLQRLINSFGTDFMAGFMAANKIDAISFLPIMSYSNAITAYTGQNIGAKRVDRLKSGMRSAHLLSFGTSVLLIPLVLFFGEQAIGIFLPHYDAGVANAGMAYLFRVVPFLFMLGFVIVQNGVYRGAGQSLVPMVISMASLWVCRVPAAYFLAEQFGPEEIFYSWPIGWLMGIGISLIYYVSPAWKKKLARIEADF